MLLCDGWCVLQIHSAGGLQPGAELVFSMGEEFRTRCEAAREQPPPDRWAAGGHRTRKLTVALAPLGREFQEFTTGVSGAPTVDV